MLQQQINDIVSARNNASPEFVSKLKEAKEWQSNIMSICQFIETNSDIWDEIISESSPKCQSDWQKLKKELDDFKTELDNALSDSMNNRGELIEAEARSTREYLNIGCIGPWRRGKSEVIAKLTGLDTWIVPTSKLDKCTGTTINIINSPYEYIEKGEKKVAHNVAVIDRYSVEEMCGILNSYFRMLNIPLTANETTIEGFKKFCKTNRGVIHDITDNPPLGKGGFCKTLDDYIDHYQEYAKLLLGTERVIYDLLSNESKAAYRPLVSYRKDPNTKEVSYEVLATKKAIVYTDFRLLGEPIGKIQIVDTPGIGEKRVGVDAALSKALKKDLDIAIALAKVAVNSDDEYLVQQFHEILKMELAGREPEKWLFYLFNLFKSDNIDKLVVETVTDNVLTDLKKSVDTDSGMKKGINLPNNHITIIDCKSDNPLLKYNGNDIIMSEDAGIAPFIKNILELMVGSIGDVDRVFYEKARVKFNNLKEAYFHIIESLKALGLKSYNTHDIIITQIKKLHKALRALDYVNVVEKIQNNINKLKGERNGEAIIHTFVEDTSLSNKEKELISAIRNLPNDDKEVVKYLATYLAKALDETYKLKGQYNTVEEFITYKALKDALFEYMKQDVVDRIDESDGIAKLRKRKNEYASCLLSDGRMNTILPESSPESFWNDFQVMLLNSANYPKLLECVNKFSKFDITIKIDVANLLDAILESCRHEDDFGKYGFSSYEYALRSFLFSLLSIETAIKDSVSNSDGSVNEVITHQNTKFEKACGALCAITEYKQHESTVLSDELYTLYSDFQDKFFYNDDTTVKQGVLERWHKLFING